jgi:hypothetical protein
MVAFTVFGSVSDPDYYYCESIARKLSENIPGAKTECFVSFEVDYWNNLDQLKIKIDAPSLMHYRFTHLVLCDNKVIGDCEAFAKFLNEKYDYSIDVETANTVLYNRNVREGFYEMLRSHNHPVVFLEFGLQDLKKPNEFESIGFLYIEL